jgi:lysyl-tRNA synthetase class 2
MSTDQRETRIEKYRELKSSGAYPYRERFERTHLTAEARALSLGTGGVRIAGRLLTVRLFGKLIFATMKDSAGKMQIALQEKEVGAERYAFFKKYVDIGDFIGVEGTIFKTKLGEITVDTKTFELLSKTLRPLPEKFHGLADQELVYRQRYLDLVMNEGSIERFMKRTSIIKVIRDYLDSHGFVEVETPVLQTKPSGAIATPFVTRHNALDMDLYLRIAPETYLKRCVAGGFEKVYEFARSFRNEGLDPSHLQDFNLLEYYVAYWNYEDNMRFTEGLVKHVIGEVNGSLILSCGGKSIDFGKIWERIPLSDLIKRDTGIDFMYFKNDVELRKEIQKRGIEIQNMDGMGFGTLVDNLYKKVSRPNIDGPLFIVQHPIELSPLARRNDVNPAVTDRFQLVVNGWEIVNAYSELIDPLEQRERFEEQTRLRKKGDREAMMMDEDFLTAMEHGMPPMSGWGMGIDRFVCLLTDQENLRDVILFPLMKPEEVNEIES